MNLAPSRSGAGGVITSLLAGQGVPFREFFVSLGQQLRRAGRRQRVVARAADRVGLRRLMRGRVRIVLPVGVARVRRLDEPPPGRAAVHRDRPHVHVRACAGVGGPPLEVEAEARQALRGAVGEHHPVAGQEPVGGGVVDQVHERVQARVAAVAGLGVDVRARRRQGVSARGAGPAASLRSAGRRGRPEPRRGHPQARRHDGEPQPAPSHCKPPHSCASPWVCIVREHDTPMGSLPDGTVTFLFTDVEGSTRLLGRARR